MHCTCQAPNKLPTTHLVARAFADSKVTYVFVAGEGAMGTYDLVFSLQTQSGDADL